MRLAPWEQWLTAVTDARRTSTASHGRIGEEPPRQSVSFRLVMAVLARYADHDTGINARPSLRRLQTLTHLSHPTVRKALDTAETLGFITARGIWAPPHGGRPVTVWALGYPTPAGFVGWGAVVNDAAGPNHRNDTAGPHHRPESNDAAGPHHRDSESMMRLERVNDAVPGGVNDAAQPHMTSSTSGPQGTEEDEEEDCATAPAPQGADTTRLEADVFAALGQRWPDDQPVVSKRSRRLLHELRANGWNDAAIVAGVRTIPATPRNPALLLEKHLQLLIADAEPRDFGVSTVDTTDTPTVVAALPIGNTPNPADGVNQKRLAAACKAHGVKLSLFADMCADLAGRGFTVEPLSHDPDIEQDNLLRVRHPAAPGWECNWPITAHRGGTLEAVIDPDLEPTEADREHLIRFWPVELDDNWLTVTPAIVDLATFRQLIDKTYPIAASLAANHRKDTTA